MQAFIPNKDFRGFIMPFFIFDNQELSCGAKLLFSALCSYARDKAFCFPSKKRLARQLNTSLNTLKAWMEQLISIGFLKIKEENGRNTFYLFYPHLLNAKAEKNIKQENKSEKSKESEGVSKTDTGVSKIDTKVKVNKLNTLIPPISPDEKSNKKMNGCGFISFEDFWNFYPKKENREKARKAFFNSRKRNKLPSFKIFQKAVDYFMKDQKWQKESGRFIPQLHNFLNDLRWEEVPKYELQETANKTLPIVHSYTLAEIEKQRQHETKERERKKLEQEKVNAEVEIMTRHWEQFNSLFRPDKGINMLYAKRCYFALYKRDLVPQVVEKQRSTALEFLESLKS